MGQIIVRAVEFQTVVSSLDTARRGLSVTLHNLLYPVCCNSLKLLTRKLHIINHQHFCPGVKRRGD